jgi:16S rRNA A1518/A1519 N6-dimethyltransferase RsmA/KsgA/DIM1 with predicted DNA glycosylase/AP lyase activity
MVLHMQPIQKTNFNIMKIENLEKITATLFSNKRKMINKNIIKILNDRQIKEILNLKMNARPSEIKPEIYYKITELYEKS